MEDILKRVLKPYKNCHYLKSIKPQSDPLLLEGEFSIDKSWYIEKTGHFNSVDFNICYNQLGYCLLALCIHNNILDGYCDWTLDDFFKIDHTVPRNLSNIFIVLMSIQFNSQMSPSKFSGYVKIEKVNKIETVNRIHDFILIENTCGFEDQNKICSTGSILVAMKLDLPIAKL